MDIVTYALLKKYINAKTTGLVTSEKLLEVEQKLVGIYHFKGSIDNEAALQNNVNPKEGDVYNIADTGMNAAWVLDENNNGHWDKFGTVVNFDDIETMPLSDIDALFE